MLILDERSEKARKNNIDHLSISRLSLKIFAKKVEKYLTCKPRSLYAEEGDTMSQLPDCKLGKFNFAYNLRNIGRNSKKLPGPLGVADKVSRI